jgi:DNA modification methylase
LNLNNQQNTNMNYQILQGDNRDTLKTIPDNSIDAIVTDPPYGIDFLGKDWDANTGALETYQECLRVLKPGGHIVAFSAARTYHHLAITLEQAGFEIRDQIMWIYSSGFPKSQDIGKSIERTEGKRSKKKKDITDIRPEYSQGCKSYCNVCNYAIDGKVNKVCKKEDCPFAESNRPADNEWSGWGTQLKPAHEPIALARKPMKGSIAKNCQQWGVGALNIDATRVPYDDPAEAEADAAWRAKWSKHNVAGPVFQDQDIAEVRKQQGKSDLEKLQSMRVPARVVLDQANSEVLGKDEHEDRGNWEPSQIGRFPSNVIGEIADYQKYFYCPKVSRKERHVGFDTANIPQIGSTHPDDVKKHPLWDPSIGGDAARLKKKIDDAGQYKGNNHPTVKPIELMKYLIKLITPPGGTVLDPFNGSGSTGCAAVELGHPYIGCELDSKYVDIANTRIEAWAAACNPTQFHQLFSTE